MQIQQIVELVLPPELVVSFSDNGQFGSCFYFIGQVDDPLSIHYCIRYRSAINVELIRLRTRNLSRTAMDSKTTKESPKKVKNRKLSGQVWQEWHLKSMVLYAKTYDLSDPDSYQKFIDNLLDYQDTYGQKALYYYSLTLVESLPLAGSNGKSKVMLASITTEAIDDDHTSII